MLWPTTYEWSSCYSAGVDHRKYIHSCLQLTLLSYQKWLYSFLDTNTLLKVLYCMFFVLPDSALWGLPTASYNNGFSVRGNCSLTNAHKNSRSSTSLRWVQIYAWESIFSHSGISVYISLSWILNMGLLPLPNTSSTLWEFTAAQWGLGPHWCHSWTAAAKTIKLNMFIEDFTFSRTCPYFL